MSDEQQMTADDARRIVAEERQRRERDCLRAIESALKEHRCRLNIIEVRVNGQVVESRVQTEALE